MSEKIVKVGIVGTGFGGFTHIPAFNMCPNAQVIAICGRDKDKTDSLAKKYNIKKTYYDYESMLGLDELDLISIALPPFLQYEHVDLAIDADKHVLCEKPFTLNSVETEKLIKKINKTDLVGAVGYQMRFQPARQTIKNILLGGDLGKIININMSYNYSSRLQDNIIWDWWSEKNMGGGVLNAMGSHQIDLLQWWFGDIIDSSGDLITLNKALFDDKTKIDKQVTSDELVIGKFELQNNLYASIVISSVAIGWKTSNIEIYGTNGALFLDGEEKLSMIRKTTAKHDLTKKEELLSIPWVSGSIWRAAFYRQIDELVDSIINDSNYCGALFEDGLKTRKVIDQFLMEKS